MSPQQLLRNTLLATAIAVLGACTTIAPTSNTFSAAGDTTAGSELRPAPDGSQRYLKAALPANSALYLADVDLQLGTTVALSTVERTELATALRNALVRHLGGHYTLVDVPATAPRVRATITDVRTSSVAGNVVSTLLLGIPADKGGAAVEFEVQAPSGERLAALSVAAQGRMVQFAGAYSRLGQAKLVLADHAGTFSDMLQGKPVVAAN